MYSIIFITLGISILTTCGKTIDDSFSSYETINNNVDPCDDFYTYACKRNTDSDRKGGINFDITDKLPEYINKIPKQTDNYLWKLKQYYVACVDEVTIDKTSDKYLVAILKNLGGWPVLEKRHSSNLSNFSLPKLVYGFRQLGLSINYFFTTEIFPHPKNSTKKIIHLDQPSFGIDRAYLIQGINNPIVQAYLQYMVNVTKILGARDDVQNELQLALEFEIELAKISWSLKDRNNHLNMINIMTVKQLQSRYNFTGWLDFFNSIFSPYAKIHSDEEINIRVPSFFDKFFNLLLNGKYTSRVLTNYAMWRATLDSVGQLSSKIRDAQSTFRAAMTGSEKSSGNRKDHCIYDIQDRMHLAVAAWYVRNNVNSSIVTPVRNIFENVRSSVSEIIKQLDWMDNSTKNGALTKLYNMDVKIGFPVELLDDAKLNDYYKEYTVIEKNHLKTSLEFNLIKFQKELKDFRNPYNKSDWTGLFGYAFDPNVIYSSDNIFYITADSLQSGMFNIDNEDYLNYASIGVVIGHEIIHSIDSTYRIYDKDGNVNNWWSVESTNEYTNKIQCFVDQYNNYKHPEVDIYMDGATTLNENIADIVGLKAAYLAYKNLLNNKPKLRGTENKTAEQMFWIAAGSAHCTDASEFNVRDTILTDTHAPNAIRVFGPPMSLIDFAKDFECNPGTTMNPIARCSMW